MDPQMSYDENNVALFETSKKSVSKGRPEDFYPEVALSKSILNPVRRSKGKMDKVHRLSETVQIKRKTSHMEHNSQES